MPKTRLRRAALLCASAALVACSTPIDQNAGQTDSSTAPPTESLLLIGNKGENTVSFIDLATGTELDRITTSARAPHEIAASPDGSQAAVVNYGDASIDIIDLASRAIVETIDLGRDTNPHGIKWLADERIIASTEGNESIVEIAPDRTITSIKTNEDGTHMVVVSPDAQYAYTANLGAGTISQIDLDTNQLIRTAQAGAGTEGIDLTPDGRELWVSNRSANTVMIYDAANLEPLASLTVGQFPLRLLITPDGQFAVTSNLIDGSLSVIDTASRKLVRTIRVSGGADAAQVTILMTRDGRTIYVAETGTDTIAEVDFETGEVRRRLPAGRQGDGLALIE